MRSILSSDTYARLAAATKRSVKMAGGSISVAEFFGKMPRQNVERWYRMRDECETRSIPLFRLAEIESDIAADGETPPIIKALADLCGYDLIRRPDGVSEKSPVSAMGTLMSNTGEACKTIADAYADGELSEEEKLECIRNLQAVLQSASETIGCLAVSHTEAD